MLCDWRAHFLPVASGISFDPSLERSRFLKRNQKLVRYAQETHPRELLWRRLDTPMRELNLDIDPLRAHSCLKCTESFLR